MSTIKYEVFFGFFFFFWSIGWEIENTICIYTTATRPKARHRKLAFTQQCNSKCLDFSAMNATILMPHSTLEYRIVGKKNTSSAQALRTPCPGAWIYMYIYIHATGSSNISKRPGALISNIARVNKGRFYYRNLGSTHARINT